MKCSIPSFLSRDTIQKKPTKSIIDDIFTALEAGYLSVYRGDVYFSLSVHEG